MTYPQPRSFLAARAARRQCICPSPMPRAPGNVGCSEGHSSREPPGHAMPFRIRAAARLTLRGPPVLVRVGRGTHPPRTPEHSRWPSSWRVKMRPCCPGKSRNTSGGISGPLGDDGGRDVGLEFLGKCARAAPLHQCADSTMRAASWAMVAETPNTWSSDSSNNGHQALGAVRVPGLRAN
jgi:hypothetical protein